jgi:hypothetical protein
MATAIQRIEKEYLLGALHYKGIPLKCFVEKNEFTFTLRDIGKDQLVFASKKNLAGFQKDAKIEMKFSVYSTQANIITFSVYIYEVASTYLVTSIPDCLYKNLQRSYSRVLQPAELSISIKKSGFYYDLNYETLQADKVPAFESYPESVNEDNIETLINMNFDWIKQKTDGYQLVLFKNKPPASVEEKAVAKQGKILSISIPDGGFPSGMENSMELFFTEESLVAFLVDNREPPDMAQKKVTEMIRRRVSQGIYSDCFIPIIFSSYIIGYVRVWMREDGKAPLTRDMIEKIRQFTAIIAFFLEHENLFDEGKKELPVLTPRLLDISVSGFLFVLELDKEKIFYESNDVLTVSITISNRVIRCKAVIIRNYASKTYAFYGCKFDDMELEDIRFLFESIYGKPFTGKELEFLSGSV